MERFRDKTISQSEWHESVSNRVVMPPQQSMSTFCVFILLSCSCCYCIVEILRTNKDSAEIPTVEGWNSIVK
ncbi:hypothetical protein EXN66_Car007839 [Channa argus]|uniref:Uncharacterized protein n=1 Tax=Channa argus TaxID=215402 RepID=A0A6G1PPQ7_CHAAH|nr:hypothetical protein EXN66_Car007839 [Channa argus]